MSLRSELIGLGLPGEAIRQAEESGSFSIEGDTISLKIPEADLREEFREMKESITSKDRENWTVENLDPAKDDRLIRVHQVALVMLMVVRAMVRPMIEMERFMHGAKATAIALQKDLGKKDMIGDKPVAGTLFDPELLQLIHLTREVIPKER